MSDFVAIPLTNGGVTLVDPEDYPLVRGISWAAERKKRSRTAYVVKSTRRPKNLYLHRLLFDVPVGMEIDHVSGDGLDNRRKNLRLATHSQNCQNNLGKRRRSSRFKGVCWDRGRARWMASIQAGERHINLGRYATEEAAAAAYDCAARELHGDFARVNGIES